MQSKDGYQGTNSSELATDQSCKNSVNTSYFLFLKTWLKKKDQGIGVGVIPMKYNIFTL